MADGEYMSQGLGVYNREEGWGHVAGAGDMWQGLGECGRVWGHVASVVAECGGMLQGWGYVVGGRAYGMDGDMWHGKGHMVWCWGMYQGVRACDRGGSRVWGHVAGGGRMWQGWVHVTRAMGIWQGEGWGHVVGCGSCGRGWGWGHVAGVDM